MPSKILVSGTSGFLGASLVPSLQATGAKIVRLTRDKSPFQASDIQETILWNPATTIAPEQVSGFDAVIHLAGESIVGRWTATKKAQIRESRVRGTQNLANALAQTQPKPKVFVCASAIGYYGDRGDELLDEESPAGTGFLPELCREWEAATQAASEAGIRTVQMRIGVVLHTKGGALARMLTPFKMGLGGRIGNGRQWMSWIDLRDLLGAIHHILNNDTVQGPVNFAAPMPVTNADFSATLAGVLHRPAIFPVPALVVKALFGEMGKDVLLASQRVEPARLIASGYSFSFRELKASLQSLLGS